MLGKGVAAVVERRPTLRRFCRATAGIHPSRPALGLALLRALLAAIRDRRSPLVQSRARGGSRRPTGPDRRDTAAKRFACRPAFATAHRPAAGARGPPPLSHRLAAAILRRGPLLELLGPRPMNIGLPLDRDLCENGATSASASSSASAYSLALGQIVDGGRQPRAKFVRRQPDVVVGFVAAGQLATGPAYRGPPLRGLIRSDQVAVKNRRGQRLGLAEIQFAECDRTGRSPPSCRPALDTAGR